MLETLRETSLDFAKIRVHLRVWRDLVKKKLKVKNAQVPDLTLNTSLKKTYQVLEKLKHLTY